jgi:CheY-like chemotaxis protein
MKKQILIVEDDNSIRELLFDAFEAEGYDVLAADNGLSALNTLSVSTPDIILMDVQMPVMDGFKFRDEHARHPLWSKIPLLAMSAQSEFKNTFDHFIEKPLELEVLLTEVSNLSSR